jgi:hypothetical protein
MCVLRCVAIPFYFNQSIKINKQMKTITLTGKSVYTEIMKTQGRETGVTHLAKYEFGESVKFVTEADAFFRHYDEGDIYTVTLEEEMRGGSFISKSFKIISYLTYTRHLELLKREKEMKELMCAEQ